VLPPFVGVTCHFKISTMKLFCAIIAFTSIPVASSFRGEKREVLARDEEDPFVVSRPSFIVYRELMLWCVTEKDPEF
jgi:hypothetical protein